VNRVQILKDLTKNYSLLSDYEQCSFVNRAFKNIKAHKGEKKSFVFRQWRKYTCITWEDDY
jgi:hypothetical protein